MNDLYHELLLEEARHPSHQGQLKSADAVLSETNASCGDQVKVWVEFANHDVTQPISDLKWQGVGCVISQAAMSVLAAKIVQEKLTLEQVKQLSERDLEGWLGIEDISPGRLKCLMLGRQALINGLNK